MIRNIIKLPVMLVFIFMLSMFVVDFTNLGYRLSVPRNTDISIALLIFGFSIIAIGGYSFRRLKTTVNPMTPEQSTQLVTTGIYNYSRNPMYIGFLSWLIACSIYIGNIINFAFLPIYIVLVNNLYILPEEKALENIFKDQFLNYKKRVRRWL